MQMTTGTRHRDVFVKQLLSAVGVLEFGTVMLWKRFPLPMTYYVGNTRYYHCVWQLLDYTFSFYVVESSSCKTMYAGTLIMLAVTFITS